MEKAISIWSRLGHWLRLNGGYKQRQALPAGDDGMGERAAMETELSGSNVPDEQRLPGALTRWSRRDHTLQRLQEGHERLVDAFTSVQQHFDSLDRRGEEIAGSLRDISVALKEAPAENKKNAALLSTIASELAESNERSGVLAETMQVMPRLARQQEEALGQINCHLSAAGQTNARMSSAMDSFGSTLGSVRDTSSAQLQTLKDMQEATRRQQDDLAALLAEQNGRFRTLLAILITFGTLLVIGIGATVWFLMNQPG